MLLTLAQLCLVVLLFGGERAVRMTAARYVTRCYQHEIALQAFIFGCVSQVDLDGCRQVPDAQCANTAAGRHFLTDSHGYVCNRRELDYRSGCCYSGDLHSCETYVFLPDSGAGS
jgi:SREBP regulating gene protein